jgi:hypothetical protein
MSLKMGVKEAMEGEERDSSVRVFQMKRAAYEKERRQELR